MAKKRDYAREYRNENPKRTAHRVELRREARHRGIDGKRKAMGKDLSHDSNGNMSLENSSTNRSRNGKGNRKTYRVVKKKKK